MKKILFPSLLLLLVLCFASCNSRQVELKIVATSDVHGNFYPYDFIRDVPADGSLSRVQTYLKAQRRRLHDRLLYVDGGDILQGQPTAYYYNTGAVGEPHLAAQMLNYMGCCMAALGNHDVETGGQTYQNYILDCDFPVLGANIVFEGTDECFLPPYKVVERKGVRIAFLGMPFIPKVGTAEPVICGTVAKLKQGQSAAVKGGNGAYVVQLLSVEKVDPGMDAKQAQQQAAQIEMRMAGQGLFQTLMRKAEVTDNRYKF